MGRARGMQGEAVATVAGLGRATVAVAATAAVVVAGGGGDGGGGSGGGCDFLETNNYNVQDSELITNEPASCIT